MGPLHGVRILDLTVVWSGPGATALLGDLGAEIIRVESVERPSRGVPAKTSRVSVPGREYATQAYAGRDPGERPYDRSPIFNWHARNKLSVSMPLDRAEGREAFLQLVAKSDVFIENNTRGVLPKLGLDYDTLSKINPRLILVRMPAMGLSGPMSDYRGYGPNFNSLVGIQAMDGYADGDLMNAGENYHMDEASPGGGAFAVMAALWERELSGKGQLVEFAQAENVIQEIGEQVLGLQMTGRVPAPMGNADPVMLQEVFATVEPDTWVAISIRHDEDWSALAAVIGPQPWLHLGATAMLRSRNAEQLLQRIGEFTASASAQSIVARLQRVGVPAGEVMSETRLLADPHLASRSWFQTRSHPAVGTFDYPGHPWRAEGLDLVWGRPVPSFGEDNDYVYRDILGYTDAQIQDLVDKKVISNVQLA